MNNNKKNNNKKTNRLNRIAAKCSEKFLSELKCYPKLGKRHAHKARPIRFQDSTPTVNELCDLARKHNFLLLFRIENGRQSVHIRIDPEHETVSQISKTLTECVGWMDPIARDGDDDDDDQDEDDDDDDDDENPIPGHEEDNEDDGGTNEDGDDDDDDDWHDDDDDDDDDDEEDDEEDDRRDDDDNHAHDGDDPRYLDEDDNAWALRRFIEVVDEADLRLSISPVRRPGRAAVKPEKITVITTVPPRTARQVINHYRWWTRKRA